MPNTLNKDEELNIHGNPTPEQLKTLNLMQSLIKAGNQKLETRYDGKQFISVDWLAVTKVLEVYGYSERLKEIEQHLLLEGLSAYSRKVLHDRKAELKAAIEKEMV